MDPRTFLNLPMEIKHRETCGSGVEYSRKTPVIKDIATKSDLPPVRSLLWIHPQAQTRVTLSYNDRDVSSEIQDVVLVEGATCPHKMRVSIAYSTAKGKPVDSRKLT